MTTLPHLHELIQSLSKQEKRHFRFFCDVQKMDPKYGKLFNYLNLLKDYNEENVLKYCLRNNLHEKLNLLKNNLFLSILDSICLLNSHLDFETFFSKKIHQLGFLYAKGFFDEYFKMLKEVKKLATDQENLEVLLQLAKLELKASRENRIEFMTGSIFSLKNEVGQLTEQINYSFELAAINREIFEKTEVSKWDDEKKENIELMFQKGLEMSTGGFRLPIEFLNSRAMFYWSIGEISEAENSYNHALELWHAHPGKISSQPERYARQVANLLKVHHLLGRYDEFPRYLQKIRSLKVRGKKLKSQVFQSSLEIELLYFSCNKCDLNFREFITRVQQEMKEHEKTIAVSNLTVIYFNLGVLGFLHHDFELALFYFDAVAMITSKETNSIAIFNKFFLIICHYENRENVNYIESLLKQVKYQLTKSGTRMNFEQKLVNLLVAYIVKDDEKKKKNAATKALELCLEKKNYANSHDLTGLDEMIIFLKSKLNNTSLLQEFSSFRSK